MSVDQQTSIIGEAPGDNVALEASGRLLKPLLEIPAALVDEHRLHADGEGLSASLVDPANVAMCQFDVPASAFDAYDLDGEDLTVGLKVGKLQSHLRSCRSGKRTADDVGLQFDRSHTRLTIERDYDHTTVARTDQFLNIDPASVRDEPDLPDLDLEYIATTDVQAFGDTIDHCDTVGDQVALRPHGEDLLMAARTAEKDDGEDTIIEASEAVFENVLDEPAEDVSQWTLYSLDYLRNLTSALTAAKVDTVQLVFGEEYPMRVEFERTDSDDETLYEGVYFIAPRIGGEEYP